MEQNSPFHDVHVDCDHENKFCMVKVATGQTWTNWDDDLNLLPPSLRQHIELIRASRYDPDGEDLTVIAYFIDQIAATATPPYNERLRTATHLLRGVADVRPQQRTVIPKRVDTHGPATPS